jgi:hypothetical protein
MDKRKKRTGSRIEDNRGFEEFIQGQHDKVPFLPKTALNARKNENGFDHLTFLTNDSNRLMKLKLIFSEKLPFSLKFEQGKKISELQKDEIEALKNGIFEISDKVGSPFRKSLSEVFNTFFHATKS